MWFPEMSHYYSKLSTYFFTISSIKTYDNETHKSLRPIICRILIPGPRYDGKEIYLSKYSNSTLTRQYMPSSYVSAGQCRAVQYSVVSHNKQLRRYAHQVAQEIFRYKFVK